MRWLKLWMGYWARFQTFVGANSIPIEKRAQVFLTNQPHIIYKLLSNLASQQSPARDINDLKLDEIAEFTKGQFDPAQYVVRERFKFWSTMDHKPGKTVHELAAHIRHDAVTYDFYIHSRPAQQGNADTHFMCSVSNEGSPQGFFQTQGGWSHLRKGDSDGDWGRQQRRRSMVQCLTPFTGVEAFKRWSLSPSSGFAWFAKSIKFLGILVPENDT